MLEVQPAWDERIWPIVVWAAALALVALAIVAYRDLRDSGRSTAFATALLVLFVLPVGVLVWIWLRSKTVTRPETVTL